MIVSGECDASAIDSVTLRLAMAANPDLASQILIIDSWGPNPIQPVVVSRWLPARLKSAIASALATFPATPEHQAVAARCLLTRFVAIPSTFYDEEDALLQAVLDMRGVKAADRSGGGPAGCAMMGAPEPS